MVHAENIDMPPPRLILRERCASLLIHKKLDQNGLTRAFCRNLLRHILNFRQQR